MSTVNSFGFWSATGACAASIAYGVPQVLQVVGVLPDPLDRILIFAPSLILAPMFVMTLATSYTQAEQSDRVWRMSALGLAVLYAGLVSFVYVNQLGVVIPREMNGLPPAAGNFAYCGFRGPMTAVDLLGYTYMSASTLLLAPTYRGATRWMLAANGLLGPAIFLQLLWPALIWVASPWIVVFPAAMALIARDFVRSELVV